jgi:hypothetical protein
VVVAVTELEFRGLKVYLGPVWVLEDW